MTTEDAVKLKLWELIAGIHTIGASILIGFIGKTGVTNITPLTIFTFGGGLIVFFINLFFIRNVYNKELKKIDDDRLSNSFYLAILTLVLLLIANISVSGIKLFG